MFKLIRKTIGTIFSRKRRVAALMPREVTPEEVRHKMAAGESFVLNISASWCPDCYLRQDPHLPAFVAQLGDAGLEVLQVTVQHDWKVFLSDEHEALTEMFGGHGYPRTALILDGRIADAGNVEVTTPEALHALGDRFIQFLMDN